MGEHIERPGDAKEKKTSLSMISGYYILIHDTDWSIQSYKRVAYE